MPLSDWTKSSNDVTEITTRSTPGVLLYEMGEAIYSLGLFRIITVLLERQQTIVTPACVFIPSRLEIVERHLAGKRFDMRFHVEIAYALKMPNEVIASDYMLGLNDKIFDKLMVDSSGRGPFILTSDHYDTNIITSTFEEVALVEDDSIMTFSSGMSVEMKYWKTVT